MNITAAERQARATAARAAMIASTRPTTKPGSENTRLRVGDPVTTHREDARSATWDRYEGRKGVVASINRQTFPSGARYCEIGVSWVLNAADPARLSADNWFRVDEVRAR
jgi:hypothetical protein